MLVRNQHLSMNTNDFQPWSRLLVMAPHPDDESLATAILLQRAAAAGAQIQIVYLTDGDDNPWPQRFVDRQWRVRALDRKRWGERRRREAVAALQVLGVDAGDARFLGYPDQKLTDRLRTDGQALIVRLRDVISEYSPTHLAMPSAADAHPDHSALGVMLRIALWHCGESASSVVQMSYVVHGRSLALGRAQRRVVTGAPAEIGRKRMAIESHRTQMMLSRRRFLGYAARPERFVCDEETMPLVSLGAIREARILDHELEIQLRISMKPLQIDSPSVSVLAADMTGRVAMRSIDLPARTTAVAVRDASSQEVIATARYRGNGFHGILIVPLAGTSAMSRVFVKLNRRSLFFDDAGWIEVQSANSVSPNRLRNSVPSHARRNVGRERERALS